MMTRNGTAMTGDRRVAALLRRCSVGDQGAAAELFDLTWASMLSVARCAAPSEQAAQDAVAEAYLEVWARAMRGWDFGPRPSLRLLALAHAAAARSRPQEDLIA